MKAHPMTSPITAPISPSQSPLDNPPSVTPPVRSSSGPPGACITPSSVTNVLTLSFLTGHPPFHATPRKTPRLGLPILLVRALDVRADPCPADPSLGRQTHAPGGRISWETCSASRDRSGGALSCDSQ